MPVLSCFARDLATPLTALLTTDTPTQPIHLGL
jgi:hypothetical protein